MVLTVLGGWLQVAADPEAEGSRANGEGTKLSSIYVALSLSQAYLNLKLYVRYGRIILYPLKNGGG